jgi:multidrug efflux system outer membrane protein
MDVAEAIRTAIAQRADMKQLALKLSSNEIDIALARSQSSPQVKANGGLTFTQDWSANRSNLGWNAGLSVSMPIVDSGAIGASLSQAQLQRDTLTVQQAQLTAKIATSVKDALYTLRDLLARVDLARASSELAQSQYDLTKLQFDNGVSSNLDVLAASVALTTAQVNENKARSDSQLGALALQNAIGN